MPKERKITDWQKVQKTILQPERGQEQDHQNAENGTRHYRRVRLF